MTQKEIKAKLNNLFIKVESLESSAGFLTPVVDPNQARWITDIEKQVVLIKVEISSLMRQLEV